MMSMIPQQKVNDIAQEITKEVMKKLGDNFQREFQKVQDEFKRMEKYINSLENRIEQLEKTKTEQGELQDTDTPRAD